MKKLTILTLIIVVSVFMLDVGCKKDPVATDLINVSVSQSRVPSGGQAYIIGYVVNPQENVYNLSIRVSEGWVSYDSTFSDRFQAIYYALENLTDYDILVGGTVHAYIITFSATQTFQMFILPKEKTEETAKSNKYYLIVDTGELYSKETGKVVKILDLELKPTDDGKNITVRVLE